MTQRWRKTIPTTVNRYMSFFAGLIHHRMLRVKLEIPVSRVQTAFHAYKTLQLGDDEKSLEVKSYSFVAIKYNIPYKL